MKIQLILAVLISLSLYSNEIFGAEYQTNFQILEQLSAEVLDEQIKPIFESEKTPVWLFALSPKDSNNWFIENVLIQTLQKWEVDSIRLGNFIQKESEQFSADKKRLKISYRINDLKIEYVSGRGLGLQSEKMIKRMARIGYYFQIVDLQTRTVVWSGNLQKTAVDDISVETIPELEMNQVGFTRAGYHAKNFYTKFVEPLVMIGTTGVIVYLFYAFRSR